MPLHLRQPHCIADGSILAVGSLIAVCAFLWWKGQKRDRAARNPLHGILDKLDVKLESALEVVLHHHSNHWL